MRVQSPFLRLASGVVPNTAGLDAPLAAVVRCAGALLALLVRLPRYMTARQARLFSDLYYPLRYIAGLTPAQECSGVAPRLCALGFRACRRTPWHMLLGPKRGVPVDLLAHFEAALRVYMGGVACL